MKDEILVIGFVGIMVILTLGFVGTIIQLDRINHRLDSPISTTQASK